MAKAPVATPEAEEPQALKPPSKNFKPEHAEKFFEWLHSIPNVEWAHLSWYLYRLWPVIVRQQKDSAAPNYIDKGANPLGVDDLLHRWGAGKYQIKLTDSNRKKFAEVCSCVVQLDERWESFPPVVDMAELDQGSKENAAYLSWRRGRGR